MKRTGAMILATIAALLPAAGARAGSIWAKSTPRTQVLYTDDTARRVGDALTIIISERSVVENDTKRDMNKKSDRSANVKSNVDLLKALDQATGKLFNLDSMDVAMSAETKFTGNAKYDTDRNMTDQITVTVQDMLPNGNLVVVGSRTREVSGDKQIIQVSGVVRPSDITFSNTVRSDQVADFHVVFNTKGIENRFTKPGWLDQILNFLNPF
jgi:flagellar L-ring protein precursor FlgH